MRAVVASRGVSGLPELAGNTWAFLQFVVGLARLGVETFWVDHQERLDPRLPARRFRPRVREDCHSIDYVFARFRAMAQAYGFADRFCILYEGGSEAYGLSLTELRELVGDVDLLLARGLAETAVAIAVSWERGDARPWLDRAQRDWATALATSPASATQRAPAWWPHPPARGPSPARARAPAARSRRAAARRSAR